MIKLYHGSNISIESIDLTKGRVGKDFGKGFYLSANREQAETMSKIVTEREGCGVPTLNTYLFDESNLTNGTLSVKKFDGYNAEWAQFILDNRQNKTSIQIHNYDIVYGPIANDRIGYQINNLLKGLRTMDEFIKGISFITPTFQYFFGTERAIALLKKL